MTVAETVEVRAYLSLAPRLAGPKQAQRRPGETAGSLALELGFAVEELGLVLVNGCRAQLDQELHPGDRVAYFPEYVPFHKIYGMCVL